MIEDGSYRDRRLDALRRIHRTGVDVGTILIQSGVDRHRYPTADGGTKQIFELLLCGGDLVLVHPWEKVFIETEAILVLQVILKMADSPPGDRHDAMPFDHPLLNQSLGQFIG